MIEQTAIPPKAEKRAASDPSTDSWSLYGSLSVDELAREFRIPGAEFRVGRRSDMNLVLKCSSVSKHHADLISTNHSLFVRDLGSTNGTFVNGNRVDGDVPVGEGDVVQFAEREFRVGLHSDDEHDATRVNTTPDLGWALSQFDKLISLPGVVPWFQPVVSLDTGDTVAYEVLARSDIEGLENPQKMFSTASRLSMDVQLSELCRNVGLQHATRFGGKPTIYLNTHPSENLTGGLVDTLCTLRGDHPEMPIVIELHEAAVASKAEMKTFRATLNDLNMQLAYDDFGAGQSRLNELIDSPPDILKFDIALIKNIHQATGQHLRMLSMLTQVVIESGITALAEGVECQEEADVIQELGFELAQGWHFGRPAPVHDWLECESKGCQNSLLNPNANSEIH